MSSPRIAPAPSAQDPGARKDAGTAFLERAEVRDVLAWMRLLLDPHDAAAVVRALARPPVELRQVHLARVIALARRRKLDLVSGLAAAVESPQVPPEARERIQRFVEMHRRAAAGLETLGPEVFIVSMIELLRTRGEELLAPETAAQRQYSLGQLREAAVRFARRRPGSTPRELALHLTGLAPETSWSARTRPRAADGSPLDEPHPRSTSGQPPSTREPAAQVPYRPEGETSLQGGGEQPGARSELEATLQTLRQELLESVSRIGGRLAELRLDTELDIAHGVVRYLELIKLAALLERPAGEDVAEALADINARLLAATTPLQREIFQTSPLDETLIGGGSPPAGREEHSLGPFLPRKGAGLALSASDIETYRSCPLRYKFSRVLRIPTEQTLQQRFGITVHQVLERFHGEGASTLEQMLELLEAAWRRAGLGDSAQELELHELARGALRRYHERLKSELGEPVWFERPFAFRIGPHHLRGRVDRVDRIPGGGSGGEYELIDYKTSRARTSQQLGEDVQLSLYALAARESWQLESSSQSYYYVLDDQKVRVPTGERDAGWITDTVLEVGEGILGQEFDPTPSRAACSLCGYRIVCPAAEL